MKGRWTRVEWNLLTKTIFVYRELYYKNKSKNKNKNIQDVSSPGFTRFTMSQRCILKLCLLKKIL